MIDDQSADTHWLMLIDTLARTYGCLPSEVLKKADSFDLMVLDVANSYHEIQHAKQNKKPIPAKYYNTEDLEEKLKRARGEQD